MFRKFLTNLNNSYLVGLSSVLRQANRARHSLKKIVTFGTRRTYRSCALSPSLGEGITT